MDSIPTPSIATVARAVEGFLVVALTGFVSAVTIAGASADPGTPGGRAVIVSALASGLIFALRRAQAAPSAPDDGSAVG